MRRARSPRPIWENDAVSESPKDGPKGDRRPHRRDGEQSRRRDAGGPQRGRSASKPNRGGKPHPSLTPRTRSGEEQELDTRSVRPRLIDPPVPDDVTGSELPRDVRAELRTLTAENQEYVARHLVMAARLIDGDPDAAHLHAQCAARRGGRIGVVRETLAITAYRVGDYALALRELRTYRRITGREDQLPLMVDSERGIGRPERALELGRSVPRARLDTASQVQLAIAMSGARLDLGQPELALQELQIPQLDPTTAYSWSPDLFAAMGTVLEELGRDAEAAEWRRRADIAEEALQGPNDDIVELIETGEDESPIA